MYVASSFFGSSNNTVLIFFSSSSLFSSYLYIFDRYRYDFVSLGLNTMPLWNKNFDSSYFCSSYFFFACSKKLLSATDIFIKFNKKKQKKILNILDIIIFCHL